MIPCPAERLELWAGPPLGQNTADLPGPGATSARNAPGPEGRIPGPSSSRPPAPGRFPSCCSGCDRWHHHLPNSVGDNMKQEDIKAKFENGVLTLQVPKKEEIPEEQTKKFITIG